MAHRIRRISVAFVCATITLAIAGAPAPTMAQSVPPLTQKTAPNRVGVNNANPVSTLDVTGTANVTGSVTAGSFRGDGSQLTNLPAPAAGPIAIQVFKSSGTYTPTPGARVAIVEVWGGGGGGAGRYAGGWMYGGGGGGYARKLYPNPTTHTVTVGAGGTAGPVADDPPYGDGGSGGATSFGSIVSATGGSGGRHDDSGNGGSGTGGDLNFTGQKGSWMVTMYPNSSFVAGSSGGAAPFLGLFGSGSTAGPGMDAPANSGGGGGAGGINPSGGRPGGVGGSGLVVVTEY